MPIGLVVVSWWRFGGVELARGLTCSGWIVEAPRHVRTLGVALFRLWTTAEEDQGQCLRFVDTVNASDAPDRQDMPPTNHASASKPTSSTEWQLGTLNGLVEVVVVVYTDPPRVSSAQTTSTQRPARHADSGRASVSWWRCGGVELARGLTRSGWTVEAPRSRQERRGWRYYGDIWTGAKAASRPMLAFRERDERVGCVGCVGSSGHPSRVSL